MLLDFCIAKFHLDRTWFIRYDSVIFHRIFFVHFIKSVYWIVICIWCGFSVLPFPHLLSSYRFHQPIYTDAEQIKCICLYSLLLLINGQHRNDAFNVYTKLWSQSNAYVPRNSAIETPSAFYRMIIQYWFQNWFFIFVWCSISLPFNSI